MLRMNQMTVVKTYTSGGNVANVKAAPTAGCGTTLQNAPGA